MLASIQSYERRSRAVKATSVKERRYWAEVTADMMSDEEKVGDKYVRHPPSYRSERLNRFSNKLDSRLETTPSRHARHIRVLGSPVDRQPPSRAKTWMVKSNVNSEGSQPNEEEMEEAPASDADSFEFSEDGTECD